MKVCLDAGHYGKYNRSPVYPSYYESDMTWKLHNYLADELGKYNVEVVKTRPNQATDLELTARGRKGAGCNLFLSLHSNASSQPTAKYALAITMRSNTAETYDEKSAEIGKLLVNAVAKVMGTTTKVSTKPADGWDRDGNGKYDDEWYGVLQGAKMAKVPGVILEHGFHTNLEQTKWLSDDANLKKLAEAEAKVIADWLGAKQATPKKEETPKSVIASKPATKESVAYKRTYTTTTSLNMRDGAGVGYKILVTLPQNTKVKCYKYYSKATDGAIWLLVAVDLNGVHYEGFVNKGWLR